MTMSTGAAPIAPTTAPSATADLPPAVMGLMCLAMGEGATASPGLGAPAGGDRDADPVGWGAGEGCERPPLAELLPPGASWVGSLAGGS